MKWALLVLFLFLIGCVAELGRDAERTGPPEKDIPAIAPIDEVAVAPEQKSETPKAYHQERQSRQHQDNRGCSGTGPVTFTVSPRRMEDLGMFVPMGLMVGDHVTPIDHGYFYPPKWKMEVTSAELKDVYVPADGVITSIQRMPAYFTTTTEADLQDYRLILHHTCTFYTIYIHLNQLAPTIKEKVGEMEFSEHRNVAIPVKAGDLLGKANAFDFSVHNDEVILSGFVNPASYEREPWKIHMVDPFDYFVEPIKSQILAKNPRTVEPRGGKIDYDIDGKLIGNWFLEGTKGYAGMENQPNYWVSHLAFAPNAYDPTHFTISMGEFEERYSRQYGAKGNAPNPAEVDASSGIVQYELVEFEYVDGSGKTWDSRSYASGIKVRNVNLQSRGIILVQLLEKRRLKVEVFPGKSVSEVGGFTENARRYVR